jgi:predicted Rossmann-fold nucleotide-binding protein
MGVLADAVLDADGEAIGVIPEALEAKEVAHSNLTELHVVESMPSALLDAFASYEPPRTEKWIDRAET